MTAPTPRQLRVLAMLHWNRNIGGGWTFVPAHLHDEACQLVASGHITRWMINFRTYYSLTDAGLAAYEHRASVTGASYA